MKRAAVTMLLAILLGAETAWPAGPVSADEAARFAGLVKRMESAVNEVRDYTCTFTKQERIGGELRPEETVFLKHRGPKVCVYMKWIGAEHQGRETIFCEGRYDDKIQAHEGSGLASWLNVSLDPTGSLAMSGSRRPVTDAGIYNTARALTDGFARNEAEARTEGIERIFDTDVHGQPSSCAVTIPAEDDSPGERLGRVEICVDRQRFLPTKVRLWDPGGELLGAYTYRDYRLNVGLTDRDFDTDNEEYDF